MVVKYKNTRTSKHFIAILYIELRSNRFGWSMFFSGKNVVIWLSNVQYSPEPNTALNLLYETFFGVYVFQCKPLSYYRIVSMIVDSVMQQLSSFCS